MGMTTVLEVTALKAAEHTPDVVVYAETKVTNESKASLTNTCQIMSCTTAAK